MAHVWAPNDISGRASRDSGVAQAELLPNLSQYLFNFLNQELRMNPEHF